MTTLAIIQARLNSGRLPNKVLELIGGKPMLQWVVDRAREATAIDRVCVATPGEDGIEIGKALEGVDVIAGGHMQEWDVLARFVHAAHVVGQSDCIVRLTGDCPFLEPEYLDKQIAQWQRLGGIAIRCDGTEGVGGEVFSMAALEDAHQNTPKTERHDREHVTPYIRRRYHCHSVLCFGAKSSVDTVEELEAARLRWLKAAGASDIPDGGVMGWG